MAPPQRRRRHWFLIKIPILSRCFPNLIIPIPRAFPPGLMLQSLASAALYMLGPILIFVTGGLLFSLSWTFWAVIIPLKYHSYTSFSSICSQGFVGFILINVIFNYISCVTTRNFGTKAYEKVVRELALATGFDYPECKDDMDRWRSEWREMILERSRQKRLHLRYQMMSKYGVDEEKDSIIPQSPSNTKADNMAQTGNCSTSAHSNTLINRKTGLQQQVGNVVANQAKTGVRDTLHRNFQPIGRSWMWLGPHEWSYCERTRLPKPPRSHYDHVTKGLILNMDHYCPWMFNVVGYFNYRYFVTFLFYTAVGMLYGAIITFKPFMMIDSKEYHEQIVASKAIYEKEKQTVFDHTLFRYNHVKHLTSNVPIPNEAAPLSFAFMMCFAVGISVLILLSFHIYLILTAQTTIEFHGNRLKRAQSGMSGEVYCNPYKFSWRRNVEQVFGTWKSMRFFYVLLPSRRENQFLPVPFEGGRTRSQWNEEFALMSKFEDDEITNSIV